MPTDSPLSAVAHVIQLSVAPVFLLVSLGTFLNLLSVRLARITDRSRALESSAGGAAGHAPELAVLKRRRRLINVAITCGVFAALLVCILISCAFVGSMIGYDASLVVAVLFITSMAFFTGVLAAFLAEIRLSAWYTPLVRR